MHKVTIEFDSEVAANRFARQLGKIIEQESRLSTAIMLSEIRRSGEIISYPAGVIDVQAVAQTKINSGNN